MKTLKQIIKEEIDDWSWADRVPAKKEGYITITSDVDLYDKIIMVKNNHFGNGILNIPATIVDINSNSFTIHFDDDTPGHRAYDFNNETDGPDICQDYKCFYILFPEIQSKSVILKYR